MTNDIIKEKILDSLFTHCRSLTSTSKEVLDRILKDLNVVATDQAKEKALQIVQEYKSTRKNLEHAINSLHAILYSPAPDSSSENKTDKFRF